MPASFEGRSRVVSLVYRVITEFALPKRDIPDAEIYAMLGAAFYRKAAEAADDPKPTNGDHYDSESSGSFIVRPPVEK